MKLPRKLNALVVEDLELRLRGTQDCLLVGTDGMPASQAYALRAALGKARCRMKVVKNSLARVAFGKAGLSGLSEHLKGTSAVLTGEGEAILAMAKVVTEWNADKAKKPVTVKAGLMGRAPIQPQDVARLAAIPSRQVLMGKLAGGIQSPVTRIAGGISGVARKLAATLQAVSERKAAAA